MGQAWKADIQIVEVRTDEYVRGLARKEYWAAAAAPEQAVMLVLAAVPEGWTAALSELSANEVLAGLRLQPGEATWVG